MNATECMHSCEHHAAPIPKSQCGAPSGGANDTCLDGSKPKYYKAKSAYAVAEPGDVASMQKEIMENGPIEVAFYVYGSFESYKGGIYKTSKVAPRRTRPHTDRAVHLEAVLPWIVCQCSEVGLDRIVALCDRSSTSYQNR
jgi:hypothetical protein